MSYLTVEVEIDHGRIVAREPAKLPEKGNGLLTIMSTEASITPLRPTPRTAPRPIGLAKGEFTVPADFNAPLPDDTLRTFEGE